MCDVKTGVELELWVVDEQGRLCDAGAVADAHERVEREFVDPLVEVRTAPHETASGLRSDLEELLSAAVRVAGANGKHLVPMGTPLTASACRANCERGRLFEAIYGSGIASAKNCAGTHVHFEKGDVLTQLNALTALDPALALVSSSPYYRGDRTATSARAQAYRTACGPAFRRYCDLWSYADGVEEWRSRVEAAYERFTAQAREKGVSTEAVERHFEPENTVLNPVRLQECQPTVEWRAPDATLPSQVLQLAVDVGSILADLEERSLEIGAPFPRGERGRLPAFPELRDLSRRAIRDGLASADVREYLEGFGFDLSAYEPISPLRSGPPTMDEPRARRVRLDQARRLREDLESLSADADRATVALPT